MKTTEEWNKLADDMFTLLLEIAKGEENKIEEFARMSKKVRDSIDIGFELKPLEA